MSKNTLLFSIEQWEFIRRLRNSGLTKEQICQAFDDLDRIERELGNLFHNPTTTTTTTTQLPTNDNLINLLQTQFNSTNQQQQQDTTLFSKSIQNFQLFMAKNIAALNFHQRLISQSSLPTNTTTTTTTTSNSSSPSPLMTSTNSNTLNLSTNSTSVNNNNNISNRVISPLLLNNESNNNNVNSLYDIEDEIKDLDEFRTYVC
jgi:hypothetical protein